MKRLLLNIMRCVLPVLFITYMASITLFAHVHVDNGVTIVHSHPFKKGSAHHHTTMELLLIHSLSNVTTDGATGLFTFSLFLPFLLCVLACLLPSPYVHAPYHGGVALRAPPVVRFS